MLRISYEVLELVLSLCKYQAPITKLKYVDLNRKLRRKRFEGNRKKKGEVHADS
jgi:hypothetical protein